MSRSEAMEQYRQALREGQRYYGACVARGQYPYPQVLEDIFEGSISAAKVDMGILDIPTDMIIGTLAAGRKAAFAGNFMPLLEMESEFGSKWISLCEAHLGPQGITDPISCFEYLGKFYVQEGHKRVSVLRSFGAPTIHASVTRIMPNWRDEPLYRAYGEFLQFYRLSRMYQVQFTHPGCYARLQKALGLAPDHEWTKEERTDFLTLLITFREACDERMLDSVRDRSLSEVVLACLEVYPLEEFRAVGTAELKKMINAILPDLRFAAGEEKSGVAVSADPADMPDKGWVGRLLDGITRPTLDIAFIYANSPEDSSWTRGHDLGRVRLEKELGSSVRVKSYIVGDRDPDAVMEEAAGKNHADLLIVTAPTLLAAARHAAADHPGLKVLVCALSVPYVGVRTYYSRTYEAKFISGAIAGALSRGEPVGYVARYPILGVPAAINAFALGVRMTAPETKVLLEWSCLPGNPVEKLRSAGARIISGHPVPAQEMPEDGIGWSTSLLTPEGAFRPISSDVWDWGRLYVQIVRGILGGSWESVEANRTNAVSYWWGLRSGVIDVKLADSLPAGLRQLTGILREGIVSGAIQPFRAVMRDQTGAERNDGSRWFTMEEIMRMDWLDEAVTGHIPTLSELLPMARETTRLLTLDAESEEEPGV